LLCTRGKVIKPDLFNQFPGSFAPRIVGVVEIPGFVDFLTTAKTDFLRGRKYREFESLYGPVREEFKSWLGELGVQPVEIAGTDEAAQLEREIRKVLEDIPELGDFFGFRTRKTVLQQTVTGTTPASVHEGIEFTLPSGEGERGEGPGLVDVGDEPGKALVENPEGGTEKATPITRTARRGPRISFASAPGRDDLAWVDGNSVIINTGHPAYAKVRSNNIARRQHSLFAIGAAIQRFLVGENGDQMFVDRLMSAWGKK
jgi:hypothetical protein